MIGASSRFCKCFFFFFFKRARARACLPACQRANGALNHTRCDICTLNRSLMLRYAHTLTHSLSESLPEKGVGKPVCHIYIGGWSQFACLSRHHQEHHPVSPCLRYMSLVLLVVVGTKNIESTKKDTYVARYGFTRVSNRVFAESIHTRTDYRTI